MLTKEQIENFRITRRASPELTEDLCRLALLGLERDERAERIGRAVLEQEGDETPRDLRCRAAQAERYGYESYGALLLAVADAMEDEA